MRKAPRLHPEDHRQGLKNGQLIDLNGADKRIRTSDLRITNAPLYQLSYIGSEGRQVYSNHGAATTSL